MDRIGNFGARMSEVNALVEVGRSGLTGAAHFGKFHCVVQQDGVPDQFMAKRIMCLI
jgi:hypothetical protein